MTRLLADSLLILHFLWILFMLAGFPLAILLKITWLRILHSLGLGMYLLLAILDWYCPLTIAEEFFRRMEVPDFSYNGSFIGRWIESLIYIESWGAPLWIFRVLAALYLLVCISSWWWLPCPLIRKGE